MAEQNAGGNSKEKPTEKRKGAAAVPIFLAITAVVMIAMLTSVSMFRSGTSKDQVGQVLGVKTGVDGLLADATITSVDPLKNEMTLRLALNPEGVFDDGSGLLAHPVTLYYDTLNGTKQVDFKTKKPLGSVDLSIPLVGDSISSYPWDVYTADVDLLFVTSSKALEGTASPTSSPTSTPASPPTSGGVPTGGAPAGGPDTEGSTSPPPSEVPAPGTTAPLVDNDPGAVPGVAPGGGEEGAAAAIRTVGFQGAQQAEPKASEPTATTKADPKKEPSADDLDTIVPVSITIYKSIPAYNVVDVTGSGQNEGKNVDVISANFSVKRAATAQAFSVAVSVVMWCLALGVLFLAISVISGRRPLELTHISVMAVVMFAMPAALRSFQPGVPPPGVLSDFYSFFWADLIVAGSLIATIFTYVKRRPT